MRLSKKLASTREKGAVIRKPAPGGAREFECIIFMLELMRSAIEGLAFRNAVYSLAWNVARRVFR